MKTILTVGAGRSTPVLIQYLTKVVQQQQWKLIVADQDKSLVEERLNTLPGIEKAVLNVLDKESRDNLISGSDIVLSMLPARFHPLILESCIKYKKDLITPSYLSSEMKALKPEINRAGILVLNEMGLDPGIDHMSAMRALEAIKNKGYQLTGFESFTGGLMAPGYDNDPWQYKLSWNPRNVVLAGQGGAVRFLHNGKFKYIPYNRVFRRTERIDIEGHGSFEGYANRDSLKYLDKYNLEGISTIYRGTLRRPGFCRAWDLFVQLGATDDSYIMEGSENMTCREFINSFLPFNPTDSVELKLMHYLKIDQDSGLMEKLQWLDIFSDKVVGLKDATPARILEHILKQKWTMAPDDKDMVVMWHKFFYHNDEKEAFQQTSALVVIGDDRGHTAMAKTVGLPMGIAAEMVLQGRINVTGLHLPVLENIYQPVLQELEKHQISFKEKIIPQTNYHENQPVF